MSTLVLGGLGVLGGVGGFTGGLTPLGLGLGGVIGVGGIINQGDRLRQGAGEITQQSLNNLRRQAQRESERLLAGATLGSNRAVATTMTNTQVAQQSMQASTPTKKPRTGTSPMLPVLPNFTSNRDYYSEVFGVDQQRLEFMRSLAAGESMVTSAFRANTIGAYNAGIVNPASLLGGAMQGSPSAIAQLGINIGANVIGDIWSGNFNPVSAGIDALTSPIQYAMNGRNFINEISGIDFERLEWTRSYVGGMSNVQSAFNARTTGAARSGIITPYSLPATAMRDIYYQVNNLIPTLNGVGQNIGRSLW